MFVYVARAGATKLEADGGEAAAAGGCCVKCVQWAVDGTLERDVGCIGAHTQRVR